MAGNNTWRRYRQQQGLVKGLKTHLEDVRIGMNLKAVHKSTLSGQFHAHVRVLDSGGKDGNDTGENGLHLRRIRLGDTLHSLDSSTADFRRRVLDQIQQGWKSGVGSRSKVAILGTLRKASSTQEHANGARGVSLRPTTQRRAGHGKHETPPK